jgi:hypothetical protein
VPCTDARAGMRSLATVVAASRTNVLTKHRRGQQSYMTLLHDLIDVCTHLITYSLKRRALPMHTAATVCARRRRLARSRTNGGVVVVQRLQLAVRRSAVLQSARLRWHEYAD